MKLWDARRYLRKIRDGCDALIEGIDLLEKLDELPNCKNCSKMKCVYRQKWGDPVRINCPMWEDKG